MNKMYLAPDLSSALLQLQTLVQSAEERGERTLIFCEDRFTLMTERAVCERLGGSFFTSVTTLARFLRETKAGTLLSKQGSVMAMRRLLAEHQDGLQCFQGRLLAKNCAAEVYETIAQLAASGVTPEMLEEADCADNAVLARKIADLAVLYRAYRSFLSEQGYLDESEYFRLLPQALRASDGVRGANLIFFGFPAFTRQMTDGLAACMEQGRTVGIFLSGQEEYYVNEAPAAFVRVAEDYGGCVTRRLAPSTTGAADRVRRGIYRPESFAQASTVSDAVELFEGADVTEELRETAAQICAYVRAGCRYRDIAVLLGDVQGYALPIAKVFAEYGIPYFLDGRKPLSEHPLARFLTDALTVAAERYSALSVARFTGNIFFGPSDAYRNYLLKYANYRGGAKREIKTGEDIPQDALAELEACRSRLLDETQFPARGTCRDYVECLRALLGKTDVQKGLDELCEKTDVALQSYLTQGVRRTEELLEEASALSGEEKLECGEFRDLLAEGFLAAEISLVPLKNDAVFVGDLTAGRILPVAHLFCLGLTSAVPACSEDTSIISDRELDYLDSVKVHVEPTVQQVNLRAREGAALNLAAFTKTLFAGYPMQQHGDETSRSELLAYLSALFVSRSGKAFRRSEGDPLSHAVNERTALVQLLHEREKKREGLPNEFEALYAALQETSVGARAERLCGAGEKLIYLQEGEALFFRGKNVLSPTLLEQYFSCPYRCFVERGLLLKPREETAVLNTDSGTFVHAVLEDVARGMRAGAVCSAADCRDYAEQCARRRLDVPPFSYIRDTAAGEYMTGALMQDAVAVACVMYDQAAGSAFTIQAVEQSISETLAETGIRGKIDRVDCAESFVRVIDYKTGQIEDNPLAYYVGQKLQLQLYLLSASKGKTPAGALYFPASADYAKNAEEKFRMKGFLNGDALLLHDPALAAGGKSTFIDAKLGGRSDKVMDTPTFEQFLRYAVLAANRGAQELKRGFIAATPYDGACKYCSYRGMCQGREEYIRKEPSIKCAEIAAIAARETGE